MIANNRIFIKFESELHYSALKFRGATISVQEVYHHIERRNKLNFKLDRIILWDCLNHTEISSRQIDPDTYIVLKRMPPHMPAAMSIKSITKSEQIY